MAERERQPLRLRFLVIPTWSWLPCKTLDGAVPPCSEERLAGVAVKRPVRVHIYHNRLRLARNVEPSFGTLPATLTNRRAT